MRIALIVDQPQRDLAGLVLVACRLCAAGHTCYLVPLNLQFGEICSLAPDLLLANYIRRINEPMIKKYLQAGIQISILDTEGGILPSFNAYEASMAQDPELRRQIRNYFSWGPLLGNHAINSGWFTSEQVVITGTPRFDFYTSPWNQADFWQSQEDSYGDNPYILINGTFTLANPRYQSTEKEMELMIGMGTSREFLDNRLALEREAMHGLAEITNNLAKKFTDTMMVFRPHPFEDPTGYDSLLEKKTNIRLAVTGDIRKWIKRAKVIIQRGSTTGIEAALSGKLVLEPNWLPSWAESKTIEAVSVSCDTMESLEEFVTAGLTDFSGSGPILPESVRTEIYNWFYHIDGKAHERITDYLLDFCNTESKTDISHCKKLYYNIAKNTQFSLNKAKSFLREQLSLPPTWSFRRMRSGNTLSWDKSSKVFGRELVQSIADSIAQASIPQNHGQIAIKPVHVSKAVGGRDYYFPNDKGRSIAVRVAE